MAALYCGETVSSGARGRLGVLTSLVGTGSIGSADKGAGLSYDFPARFNFKFFGELFSLLSYFSCEGENSVELFISAFLYTAFSILGI